MVLEFTPVHALLQKPKKQVISFMVVPVIGIWVACYRVKHSKKLSKTKLNNINKQAKH